MGMDHVARPTAPLWPVQTVREPGPSRPSDDRSGVHLHGLHSIVSNTGPPHFSASASERHLHEPSTTNGRSAKKAKLDDSHGYAYDHAAHGHETLFSASPARRSLPTLQPAVGSAGRSTALSLRPADTESSAPRFFATVLDTNYTPDASLNGVPSTWGPYSRGTSQASQPVTPALASDLFSRQPSANYVHGTNWSSPISSTGSVSRDGSSALSHGASPQNRSPPAYPYADLVSPRSASHGDSSSVSSTSPNSHAILPPTPSLVRDVVTAYNQPPTYYGTSTISNQVQTQTQTVQPLYNSNSYYSPSPRIPSQEIPRHLPAQPGYHSEVLVAGSWTGLLEDAGPDSFELRANRGLVNTSPASLHNIVHPVNYEPDSQPSNQLQLVQTAKGQRRGRSSFNAEKREETSKTRSIGACLRCKHQRIRCVPSPDGPNHACETCQKVCLNSKKVLHDIHCVRWKLSEMRLFRFGGLNLTQRWSDTVMKNIAICNGNKVHEIEMKIFYSSSMHQYDLCPVPVKLRVHRFEPNPDDVLIRKWIKHGVDEHGAPTRERAYVELPPYSLADVAETTETLTRYFQENAMHAMIQVASCSISEIRCHMEALIRHYYSLPNGDVEKSFLERFFVFWFCIRFTTGSAYISGPDKLGCLPVQDADYPLGKRISVPRMITAQCDSIMVTKFLRPLSSEVLNEFERFFHTGNPDNWFMLYACTFMLLHEVAFSSQDRRRHAVENWITDDRYSVSDFVMDLQFGANIILCYWHYYRTMDPSDEGWDIFCQIIKPNPQPRGNIESARGKGKKKVHVTQEQCTLLQSHWSKMTEIAKKTKTPEMHSKYEHPLYFVSQMYVKGWKTLETYCKKDKES